MIVDPTAKTEIQDALQAVTSTKGSRSDSKGGAPAEHLFEQFSAILDKIAVRLSEEQAAPMGHSGEKNQQLARAEQKSSEASSPQPATSAAQKGQPKPEKGVQKPTGKTAKSANEDQKSSGTETSANPPREEASTPVAVEKGVEEAAADASSETIAEAAPQEQMPVLPVAGNSPAQGVTEGEAVQQVPTVPQQPVQEATEQPQAGTKQLPQQQTPTEVPEQQMPQQEQKELMEAAKQFFATQPNDRATLERKGEQSDSGALLERFVQMLLADQQASPDQAADQFRRPISAESMIASLVMRQALENAALGKNQEGAAPQPLVNAVAAARGGEAGSEKGQNGLTEGAGQAQRQQSLSRAQTVRTLERVESVLHEMAKSRDGKTISLRLDPPSLGNVRVDVTYREGVLHARLSAENPAVNNMLRDRSHELQRSLRELGIEADQVSVSVSSDGESWTGSNGEQREAPRSRTSAGLALNGGIGAAGVGGANRLSIAATEDHWVA